MTKLKTLKDLEFGMIPGINQKVFFESKLKQYKNYLYKSSRFIFFVGVELKPPNPSKLTCVFFL